MYGIERDEVVDRLADVLRHDERIAGLVLIGSGAIGYLDERSDVDLIAVVANGHDEGTVSDDLIGAVCDALPVVWQLESATIPTLRSLLLEGYLEVDLSFAALDQLRATEPRCKVVFDHTGEIAGRLAVVQPARDPGNEAPIAYLRAVASLWFGLKALRRNETLNSSAQLADLRDALARLYALREGRPATGARSTADSLPHDQRARLVALTVAPEPDALQRAFARGVEALHDLETHRTADLIDARYIGLGDWIAAKYGLDAGDEQPR
jgi:hypothetical protein